MEVTFAFWSVSCVCIGYGLGRIGPIFKADGPKSLLLMVPILIGSVILVLFGMVADALI